jgi:hypothetical protein
MILDIGYWILDQVQIGYFIRQLGTDLMLAPFQWQTSPPCTQQRVTATSQATTVLQYYYRYKYTRPRCRGQVITYLGAGEQVVGLAWVEHHLHRAGVRMKSGKVMLTLLMRLIMRMMRMKAMMISLMRIMM